MPDNAEIGGVDQCRYMAAAYPTLDASETCDEHHHDPHTFALAEAFAGVFQQSNPSDEQVAWFLNDATAVVDDFDPKPESWQVTGLEPVDEPGLEFVLTINGVEYVIQENDSGGHVETHPVARLTYRSWLCTCGMEEQERTGHSPQHDPEVCDLADDEEPHTPPGSRDGVTT